MALQRENRRLSVSKRPSPFIEPALATAINKVPSSERWFHEVKFDGYRVQLHLANETSGSSPAVSQISWARFRRRFSLGLANAKACCFSSSASAEMRLHQRLLLPRPSSDVIGDDGTFKRVTSGSAIMFSLQSIVDLLGFTADYSAVITPPLFCCEPHGFGPVATTAVHPALYQCLFPLRARHGEDAREVPLNFRLPSEVLPDW
jgi:hypothetical protein